MNKEEEEKAIYNPYADGTSKVNTVLDDTYDAGTSTSTTYDTIAQ